MRTPVASLAVIVIAYLALVTVIIGIDRPAWSDEGHFVETVREFADRPVVEAVRDYRQVTPPLTFIVYGLWGSAFGTDLPTLRILSLLIAAAAHILFGLLLIRSEIPMRAVLLGMATFLLNPYTIGLSLFVFTDMLMVLSLLVVVHGVRRSSGFMAAAGVVLGLLTRQYFAFVVIALCTVLTLRWSIDRSSAHIRLFMLVALACIPLVILMMLWNGPAPPSGLAYWVPRDDVLFRPGAVVLYIGLLFTFLLPVVVLQWKCLVFSRVEHVILAAVGLLYWLMPVEPSAAAVAQTGRETVGLFHRALVWLSGPDGAHAVLWVAFSGGLHVLWAIVRALLKGLTERRHDLLLFVDLLILSFLVVQPLSYQVWEKYIIVLIPVLVLRILSFRSESAHTGS